MITLNAQQQAAADAITAMLTTDRAERLLLLGYAGTGKTRTLATALGSRSDVLYVTPSHKAKNVLLDMMPSADVITVHRALGYKPHYARGVQYFAQAEGAQGMAEQIGEHKKRVIVLDECSMVGGGIFELLLRELGFLGESGGAATILHRRIREREMDALGGQDHVVSLVWGHKTCPQDGAPVIGRPRFDTHGALVYRVRGPRVPIKLIVMGDQGQLPPVVGSVKVGSPLLQLDPELVWCAREDHLVVKDGWVNSTLAASPTLNPKHYDHVYQLTELMRAGAEDLRAHNLGAREGAEQGRVYKLRGSSSSVARVVLDDLVTEAVEAYRAGADCTVLAFRNAVCGQLNDEIRRQLVGPHAQRGALYPGEPCDLHSPVQLPDLGARLDNGDLVYTQSVTPTTWREELLGEVYELACSSVVVKRQRDGLVGATLWLSQDQQRARDYLASQLDERVEQAEVSALGCADPVRRQQLVDAALLMDELRRRLRYELFADIRPAYCKTVHKSQGGTWATVYYVQSDVATAPRSVAPKLAYVAVSRASTRLVVAG